MATNLAIDNALIEEALKIGGHRTKKVAVTEALKEYIQRRKQLQILDLFGRVEFDLQRTKTRRMSVLSIRAFGHWPSGEGVRRLVTLLSKSLLSLSRR